MTIQNSQLRKHLKFKLIHKIRQFYWNQKLANLGKRVFIDKNVRFLRFPKNISILNNVILKEGARICSCNSKAIIQIGANTTIGYHNFIFASDSIIIGDDCLIAPFAYFVDSNHKINKEYKINEQPNETAPIVIGNDVWIASNVTILKGVTIGDGAVIAANSVVNSNIEPYSVYGGTPAKFIKRRS